MRHPVISLAFDQQRLADKRETSPALSSVLVCHPIIIFSRVFVNWGWRRFCRSAKTVEIKGLCHSLQIENTVWQRFLFFPHSNQQSQIVWRHNSRDQSFVRVCTYRIRPIRTVWSSTDRIQFNSFFFFFFFFSFLWTEKLVQSFCLIMYVDTVSKVKYRLHSNYMKECHIYPRICHCLLHMLKQDLLIKINAIGVMLLLQLFTQTVIS